MLRALRLPLEEAEALIIGACLDDEAALRLALQLLPLRPFASDKLVFNGIFYALAAWLERGDFDPLENRRRLAEAMTVAKWPAPVDVRSNEVYLDSFFCPSIIPEYVEQLCREVQFPPLPSPLKVDARRGRG